MMETALSIWKFDKKRGELVSNPRIWDFPKSKKITLIKFYIVFAVLLGFLLIPTSLLMFPIFFDYSFYIETFGEKFFLIRFLIGIVTNLITFLVLFWPVLLSIRKALRIRPMNGKLYFNNKAYLAKDILYCGLKNKRTTNKYGSHTNLVFGIEFQNSKSFELFFTIDEETKEELKNFLAYLEENLLIKCSVENH